MFDSKHYVPILRWKTAEKEALKALSPEDRSIVTPLLEIVMPPRVRPKKGVGPKTSDENNADSISKLEVIVPRLPSEIEKYWGKDPIFIDLSLLLNTPLKTWGYKEIMAGGHAVGVHPIPVVHLEDKAEVEDCIVGLAKQYGTGLCLRILRSDVTQKIVGGNIDAFLTKHSLKKGEVDLLVDFELVEKMTGQEYERLANTLENIPDIMAWRTLTVAAGAFPFDLTHLRANDTYRIARTDWTLWLEKIYRGKLKRKPAFADYTIQHPVYTEPNPSANPSASIRYTAETEWVIVRGEALLKAGGAGHAQYPSNAQLLALAPEFKGEKFSAGDAYIAEKGKDVDNPLTGNPRTWLRAGVNHHVVLTARQLASLT